MVFSFVVWVWFMGVNCVIFLVVNLGVSVVEIMICLLILKRVVYWVWKMIGIVLYKIFVECLGFFDILLRVVILDLMF